MKTLKRILLASVAVAAIALFASFAGVGDGIKHFLVGQRVAALAKFTGDVELRCLMAPTNCPTESNDARFALVPVQIYGRIDDIGYTVRPIDGATIRELLPDIFGTSAATIEEAAGIDPNRNYYVAFDAMCSRRQIAFLVSPPTTSACETPQGGSAQ
jgi:hypothetical protein